MDAIAADGIGSVRLEHIAARAGMSIGHVMYYFGTRDRLLAETLCWSELDALAALTAELAGLAAPMARAERFVERFLPQAARDPRWSLWFQLSARGEPMGEVEALVAANWAWRTAFIEIVASGVEAGAFAADAGDLAEWFLPYLDGLGLQLATAGATAPDDVPAVRARALARLRRALGVPPTAWPGRRRCPRTPRMRSSSAAATTG